LFLPNATTADVVAVTGIGVMDMDIFHEPDERSKHTAHGHVVAFEVTDHLVDGV